MEPIQVILVSAPGRQLENLQSLLDSIDLPLKVETVKTCQSAIDLPGGLREAIVIIDYRFPEKTMEKETRNLILNFPAAHHVLLQNRNDLQPNFIHNSTTTVVYDEMSIGFIKNLLQKVI